ncbi:MAG: hypothetical protein HY617_00605, partial [Candidatus Sungbacteria bacterium]|nr:hypothetical protein [Candidatus Sungbacteria bacterium]
MSRFAATIFVFVLLLTSREAVFSVDFPTAHASVATPASQTQAVPAYRQAGLLSSFTSFFSNDTIANFFLKIIPPPSLKPAPKPSTLPTPSLSTTDSEPPTPPAPFTPPSTRAQAEGSAVEGSPSPTIITRITERILQPITQITKIIETTTIDNTS